MVVTHWSGEKIKTNSVVEYNKYMEEVSRADQHMSQYSISKKHQMDKKVLYFLILLLLNLFLVHRKINNNKMTYKKFLLTVAIALIEQHEIQYLGTEEAEPSNAIERTVAAQGLCNRRLVKTTRFEKAVSSEKSNSEVVSNA
jgi:hypothetical protein